MKNRVPSENQTPGASQSPPETPILNAVRMEIAALCRAMIEDQARLDRQRRRVDLTHGANLLQSRLVRTVRPAVKAR